MEECTSGSVVEISLSRKGTCLMPMKLSQTSETEFFAHPGKYKADFTKWIQADFREWSWADYTYTASQQTLLIVSGSPTNPILGEVTNSPPHIGNSLWVIGNKKKESSVYSHTVVEKGGKKEREKECVVALTQPFFFALERREIKF